ncbi:MAG: response regulator [Desulfuromonadales bacterium]
MTISRKKALLVDDAELLLDLEKDILAGEDLDVLAAVNAHQALDLITRESPDIIFIDLYMPGMDGDELCRRIKNDPRFKGTPVIMVTGSHQDEGRQRCEAAGCDALLLKPIDRQKMVEITRNHLETENLLSLRVAAQMRVRYGFGGEILTDFAVNLSAGGIFLETDRPLPENTTLQIAFDLPAGGGQINCRGKVAWVNGEEKMAPRLPMGMGIQFLNLGLKEMNALRGYLVKREIRSDW